MLPVFTAEEMRRLDRRAIDTLGIPGATLMENAGQGAAREIARLLPRGGRGARVVIVCGKGGNGSDGFVVARRLKQSGARVAVWLTTRSEDIGGDAGAKLTALRRTGLRPVVVEDEHHLAQALGDADLVVDALLGTGARGAPSGVTAGVIEAINASGRRVVSLDIPSGLPADGGPPAGSAVNAEVTTTFAGLKRGLVTGAGLDWAGRAVVVGIGVPDAEVRRGVSTFLLEQDVTSAGRRTESDVFLNDITVSRKHAEFQRRGGSFFVVDLGSLNGTYVNHERVDETKLANGDEVQIGKFKLVFFAGE